MLNPNNDRLNYGELLSPPNYQLDFAIGTTYSLDLSALLGVSILFKSSVEFDSNLSDDSIFLLDALRDNSQKVALFCDNGQIHYPNNVTPLFILIEDMVFQVDLETKTRKNHYYSFHPKFWLLRYIDEGDNVLYRLIVLSRNLTFDKSWDVSFSIDGHVKEESNDKNDAIISFIKFLTRFSTNREKTNRMNEIAEELKYIHFDLKRSIFDDYEFFINGIGDDMFSINNDNLFNNKEIDKLLVMSPFISKKKISDFNSLKLKSNPLLFTQFESLKKLKADDCNNFDIYVLKDEVVYNELSVDGEIPKKQTDIHAKLYLTESKGIADLYLGSLNASTNALNGNVEFMIKLRTRRNNLNIKKLSEDLFAGKEDNPGNPFEKIDFNTLKFENESKKKDLGSFVKDIVRLNPLATINFKNGNYDVELEFDEFDKNHFDGLDVKIKPLLVEIEGHKLSNRLIFENLGKLELSEFYSIHIVDLKDEESINKVIKVPTKGMPADRQKEVLSKFISTEQDFINYVAFLLGDAHVLASIQKINVKANNPNDSSGRNLTELYERMLKAAYLSPKKFKELSYLIENLTDKNIIPEGFVDLYNTFMEVVE